MEQDWVKKIEMNGVWVEKMKHCKRRMFVTCLLLCLLCPAQTVCAVTIYESDGMAYEEGYIFVGESHVGLMARTAGELMTNADGDVNGLAGVRFLYREDGSVSAFEDGSPNTMYMKGNLFFVYEGWCGKDEGAVQTAKTYIYSDGQGKRGRGVERVHEIMDTNPNIAHWNIVCWQGAAAAALDQGTDLGKYYVDSYKNWITYEFPDAEIYFLSQSTMTKCYRRLKTRNCINNALAAAFPERYLDYMGFFQERYPQGMADPKEQSDTIHWSNAVYAELITDLIQTIQRNRGIDNHTVEVVVTETEAVLYTNDSTVIYSSPDLDGEILFSGLEEGLPIHVTGITDNGFFRVDLGEMTAYIHGVGIKELQ